ncbi:PREDICTED: uncharacterized protein LOC109225563 isoform X1 [Nicotiana attenuata]|uniref:uncharacterized protein LOC109225563 isoform X1 n=1 Tax=Nicotiana attenuata TaxID=49451 RepID=UPI000904CD86|nr:PREDICTED: uncharacterized protein LOC109225563 isoform X1 [Nicotiana attenuata]
MEGLKGVFRRSLSHDGDSNLSSISAVLEKSSSKSSGAGSVSAADQSQLLLARPPRTRQQDVVSHNNYQIHSETGANRERQVVSLWTCSKICAICFVAGVFVGYTLKRRVRRWASKLLRRLKDE